MTYSHVSLSLLDVIQMTVIRRQPHRLQKTWYASSCQTYTIMSVRYRRTIWPESKIDHIIPEPRTTYWKHCYIWWIEYTVPRFASMFQFCAGCSFVGYWQDIEKNSKASELLLLANTNAPNGLPFSLHSYTLCLRPLNRRTHVEHRTGLLVTNYFPVYTKIVISRTLRSCITKLLKQCCSSVWRY